MAGNEILPWADKVERRSKHSVYVAWHEADGTFAHMTMIWQGEFDLSDPVMLPYFQQRAAEQRDRLFPMRLF